MMPAGTQGGSPTDLLKAWQVLPGDLVNAGLRKLHHRGVRHQGAGLQRLLGNRQWLADGGEDGASWRGCRCHPTLNDS